jgi:hypothetical protein
MGIRLTHPTPTDCGFRFDPHTRYCDLVSQADTHLARIEQLIDQVRLRAVVTFDHVRHKQVGEPMFLVESAQHLRPFNPQDSAVRNCSSACPAEGLIRGDASFAQEIAGAEQRDRCLLALFREQLSLTLPS